MVRTAPAKRAEFRRRYARGLAEQEAVLAELRGLAREGTVTLVYSSQEIERNNAIALREMLTRSRRPRA